MHCVCTSVQLVTLHLHKERTNLCLQDEVVCPREQCLKKTVQLKKHQRRKPISLTWVSDWHRFQMATEEMLLKEMPHFPV